MKISVIAKILNFLIIMTLAASTVMAETTESNQSSEQQTFEQQDQRGKELPDDDMMDVED